MASLVWEQQPLLNNANPYEYVSLLPTTTTTTTTEQEEGEKNPREEVYSLVEPRGGLSKSCPEWRERDKKGWSRDKEGLHQLFLSMHQPSW